MNVHGKDIKIFSANSNWVMPFCLRVSDINMPSVFFMVPLLLFAWFAGLIVHAAAATLNRPVVSRSRPLVECR